MLRLIWHRTTFRSKSIGKLYLQFKFGQLNKNRKLKLLLVPYKTRWNFVHRQSEGLRPLDLLGAPQAPRYNTAVMLEYFYNEGFEGVFNWVPSMKRTLSLIKGPHLIDKRKPLRQLYVFFPNPVKSNQISIVIILFS